MRTREHSDLEVRCRHFAHLGGVGTGMIVAVCSVPSIAIAPFVYEQHPLLSVGLIAAGTLCAGAGITLASYCADRAQEYRFEIKKRRADFYREN